MEYNNFYFRYFSNSIIMLEYSKKIRKKYFNILFEKTKSWDASIRSNSAMNVDNQNPKDYRTKVSEDLILEHESEYQWSQPNLKRDIEEENIL